MTGGQSLLAFEDGAREESASALAARVEADPEAAAPALLRPSVALRVIEASAAELAAHAELTALLQKASGGRCLWLQPPACAAA
jgi:hypothetical protein